MGLPSVDQLNELAQIELDENKVLQTTWKQLYGFLQTLVISGAPSAAQGAVTHGAAQVGVTSGLTIMGSITVAPIGAALAPWIGAAMVASKVGKVMGLYDIKNGAVGNGVGDYPCSCGHCQKNIQYIIDKQENKAAYIAIGVATLGVFTIGKASHSFGKWAYSLAKGQQRPKERVSRELVNSARKNKCRAAMAIIFLLSGSWSLHGSAEQKTWCTAIAIIASGDGWEEFQKKW